MIWRVGSRSSNRCCSSRQRWFVRQTPGMEMLHAGRSAERVRAAPSLEHEPERDRNELKVLELLAADDLPVRVDVVHLRLNEGGCAEEPHRQAKAAVHGELRSALVLLPRDDVAQVGLDVEPREAGGDIRRNRAHVERDRDVREPAQYLLCDGVGRGPGSTRSAGRERKIVLEREVVVAEISAEG